MLNFILICERNQIVAMVILYLKIKKSNLCVFFLSLSLAPFFT